MRTPEGHEELLEFDDTRYNMDYFEAAPRDLKPGIKILNVSKVSDLIFSCITFVAIILLMV